MPDNITDDCPEAFRHGPPDAKGRCPFCGGKCAPAVPAPRSVPVTELTEWYGVFYDPDWGVEDPR